MVRIRLGDWFPISFRKNDDSLIHSFIPAGADSFIKTAQFCRPDAQTAGLAAADKVFTFLMLWLSMIGAAALHWKNNVWSFQRIKIWVEMKWNLFVKNWFPRKNVGKNEPRNRITYSCNFKRRGLPQFSWYLSMSLFTMFSESLAIRLLPGYPRNKLRIRKNQDRRS